MLDRQYDLYSVGTEYFYSNREYSLHKKILACRTECSSLRLKAQDTHSHEKLLLHKKEIASKAKAALRSLLSNKTRQNERTNGKDHLRILREGDLNDTDIISAFDSYLSRTIGIFENERTDALLVVQVYYFDLFRDLLYFGFTFKNVRYRYLTSSAGQIRKKKAVFIQSSLWEKIEMTVMCGLTLDKINKKGGNNVNKHLAYLALSNSATDEWYGFDIEKTIVINDFSTNVRGTFDFVDETSYLVTRKTSAVPILHTDGAGMMLPSVSTKNFMFRAPWMKGLLGVFDFQKFIKVNHCSPVITDLYGKPHDILAEDIQIIFTKSQFKMYKYYDSWDEYKACFQAYGCKAGICNVEESRVKNAKTNYQILQTLTDITNEEIDLLIEPSKKRIENVCRSKETMMEILGVTPYNTHMTPFQKAVKLYPALLNDVYAKDVIREVKNSLLKKYRSGKLEINGKYVFLLPDYYAACEYWFCHNDHPQGLLKETEVFCWLFRRYDKLDCLRSPHLYREHAIRRNAANDSCQNRSETLREWFLTDAVYTSAHDTISRLLQFDVDGDKSLLIADPDFIRIAERNMEGIVPLYYNMQEAKPQKLDLESIFFGLEKAFTSGNIGQYSNDISKIWNHRVFTDGTDEEKQEALTIIKLLCMENNFCIDAAKTLYMPKRAPWFSSAAAKYTSRKLPAFFKYAKDKEDQQLEQRNKSLVNRIYEKIPDCPINTRHMQLDNLDYKMMMADERIRCDKEVSRLYERLNKKYRYMISRTDEKDNNLRYIACKLREEFRKTGYSDKTVADMLVEFLYGQKKRGKHLLWFCYGQLLLDHLKEKTPHKSTKFIQCADCGEWLEIDSRNVKKIRCESCQKNYRKQWDRMRKQKKT